MTLTDLINRPCTITRRTAGATQSAYGDLLVEETTTAAVCELQQRQHTEDDELGELSITVWDLFLLADTDIQTGDAITVDGIEYEVIGDPWRARNPRTQTESHVQATVKRSSSTGEPVGS